MNPLDDQLDRLLRAAARAPQESAAAFPAPFGLETRVMATWRESASAVFWNTGLLLRGLVFSSLIMLLCLWPAFSQKSTPEADYLQLADSSLPVENP
jgi:hypothetical protein